MTAEGSAPDHSDGHQQDGQQAQHLHADGSHEEHPVPRLSIVPLRHTKVVHLIRHGQGFHNVAGHDDPVQYQSFEWEDAHLTELGWKQSLALRQHIKQLGGTFQVDVVVISPLTRTLETAAGVFGTGTWHLGDAAPAFMLPQAGIKGKRAASDGIAYAGGPPLVAWEDCREILGKHPCDKRRPMSHIRPRYPAVDFSLIKDDEDTLWQLDHRETKEEIKHRGLRFMQWLMARPERHIAVVSHSSFLHFMMTCFGHDASATVQGELHKWYENCEMRSVVLSDRGGVHGHACAHHFHGGHGMAG